MKKAKATFLYRVTYIDPKGKAKKHLAEVISDTDINARRTIIHTIMAEEGYVKAMITTDARNKLSGEGPKRIYKDI